VLEAAAAAEELAEPDELLLLLLLLLLPLPFQTSSPTGVSRISVSIASAESTQRLRPLKSFMLSL
jgi:hypothetical protein